MNNVSYMAQCIVRITAAAEPATIGHDAINQQPSRKGQAKLSRKKKRSEKRRKITDSCSGEFCNNVGDGGKEERGKEGRSKSIIILPTQCYNIGLIYCLIMITEGSSLSRSGKTYFDD